MWRLRRLAEQLEASSCMSVAGGPPSSLLLHQHDDGSLATEDLERLEQLEAAAVARQDYRQAAWLHSTVKALRPRPSAWTPDQCMPLDLPAQVDFFLRNGFVLVDRVLGPEQLHRAREAWNTARIPIQRDWEARGQPDGYFDIPNLLELDDVFVDMVDSPALLPLMSCVTGFADRQDSGAVNGSTRVSKMTGRVVPSSSDAPSYTWWHNDVSAL